MVTTSCRPEEAIQGRGKVATVTPAGQNVQWCLLLYADFPTSLHASDANASSHIHGDLNKDGRHTFAFSSTDRKLSFE